MISKKDFLKELKLCIEEKAINEMNLTEKFEISKKLINRFIKKIFGYLSLNDVYINIFDNNFEKLIIKDLINEIMNFNQI